MFVRFKGVPLLTAEYDDHEASPVPDGDMTDIVVSDELIDFFGRTDGAWACVVLHETKIITYGLVPDEGERLANTLTGGDR